MFAYQVLDRLKSKLVTIDSQTKVNQLILMLIHNNVFIPYEVVTRMEPLLTADLHKYMVMCLDSGVTPINLSTNKETAQFFTMMYVLNVCCTKGLRLYVESQVEQKEFDMFNCGYRAYRKLLKTNGYDLLLNYDRVENYFRNEIGKGVSKMVIKTKKQKPVANPKSTKRISHKRKLSLDRRMLARVLKTQFVEITPELRRRNAEGYSYNNNVDKEALYSATRSKSHSEWVKIYYTPMGGSNKKY